MLDVSLVLLFFSGKRDVVIMSSTCNVQNIFCSSFSLKWIKRHWEYTGGNSCSTTVRHLLLFNGIQSREEEEEEAVFRVYLHTANSNPHSPKIVFFSNKTRSEWECSDYFKYELKWFHTISFQIYNNLMRISPYWIGLLRK